MPYQEPLKKGQEVFVRRPIQVYATVIGPRDFGVRTAQMSIAFSFSP